MSYLFFFFIFCIKQLFTEQFYPQILSGCDLPRIPTAPCSFDPPVGQTKIQVEVILIPLFMMAPHMKDDGTCYTRLIICISIPSTMVHRKLHLWEFFVFFVQAVISWSVLLSALRFTALCGFNRLNSAFHVLSQLLTSSQAVSKVQSYE